jgi:hypothetical protein
MNSVPEWRLSTFTVARADRRNPPSELTGTGAVTVIRRALAGEPG